VHQFKDASRKIQDAFCERLVELLGLTAELAGKPRPSHAVMQVWISDLSEYPINMIEKAFAMHRKGPQAQFSPIPQIGMIVGHLEELKAIMAPHLVRPSAHTAWSIAKDAANETLTVVWNNEIAQAWYRVKSITDDRYHAPKAFMEEYERIVRENKLLGRDPVVEVSLGSDPERRHVTIENAVISRLLTSQQATPYLAAPKAAEGALTPMLGNSVGQGGETNNDLDGGLSIVGQNALVQMKKYLSGPSLRAKAILAQEEKAIQGRAYQDFLRQEQQRKFEAYQQEHPELIDANVAFPSQDIT